MRAYITQFPSVLTRSSLRYIIPHHESSCSLRTIDFSLRYIDLWWIRCPQQAPSRQHWVTHKASVLTGRMSRCSIPTMRVPVFQSLKIITFGTWTSHRYDYPTNPIRPIRNIPKVCLITCPTNLNQLYKVIDLFTLCPNSSCILQNLQRGYIMIGNQTYLNTFYIHIKAPIEISCKQQYDHNWLYKNPKIWI